eukprot:CAMPEP_0194106108 /NCGR_PEP_ID=MMETSP0150-20130528/6197_1 /TAXON_ID=122233 /ORGANISM="Chaetoceros debilis, Strain MM31A-1" /LENGTH=354 /DNA_ID=CAMNT_0038794173 /DNA_START=182 /DNA_END=1246 /DNA_ORIENTATION=-
MTTIRRKRRRRHRVLPALAILIVAIILYYYYLRSFGPVVTEIRKEEIKSVQEVKSIHEIKSIQKVQQPIQEKKSIKGVIVKVKNYGNEFSMMVYRNNDIVSYSIVEKGGWEVSKVAEFNSYFTRYSEKHNITLSDLTFIDIGANVGWFSLNMAALGVNVLAFEPMQKNIDLIHKSLSLPDNIASGVSSRIKLHPHGLGAKNQTCIIFSDDHNEGDGHVKCVGVEKESDLKLPRNYSVRGRIPVYRLDDVVDTAGMHIVAAKMDTEGYEDNVLEGGRKVLLGLEGVQDAIITEFAPKWITEKGGDPTSAMKKIFEAGFLVKKTVGYMSENDMMDMTKFSDRSDLVLHSQSYRSRK